MSKKERFDTVPTHIEGVLLRKEPGIELDILKKTIEEFLAAAKLYDGIKSHIDTLIDEQAIPRKEILKIVQATEGLRGIILEKENRAITVYPSEEVTWYRDPLKKSLGISYSAFVRETLVVLLRIPLGYQTKKRIVISEEVMEMAIKKALLDLGISEEELTRIVSQQVYLKVDQEGLNRAIAQKKVELESGAMDRKIIWNIRPRLYKNFEAAKA